MNAHRLLTYQSDDYLRAFPAPAVRVGIRQLKNKKIYK
jgi:hypothetical protein